MSALQAGVVWDLAVLPARASSVQAGHSPRSAWKRGSPAVQGCHVLVCLKLEQFLSLITSNIRDVPRGGCISLTLCISVLSGLLAALLWMFSASMVPFWYLYLHWNIHPFFFPHSLHFWGLSSLLKPAREIFGVNIFPSCRLNWYFLSNSHLSMDRVLKRAVYSC